MPAVEALQLDDVLPEPGRFWIRHAPRAWPGPDREWVDLAGNRIAGRTLRRPVDLDLPAEPGDVVYLPPVEPAAALERQRLAERCAQLGLPVVAQMLPGEAVPAVHGIVVLDLTEPLLRHRVGTVRCPAAVWCLWPLVPGLSDEPATIARELERLAAAGVAGVRPVTPELSAATRRRLAAFGGVASYQELFHATASGEREFLRVAARLGLAVQPPRPSPTGRPEPPNRRLATHFALLADLWLACGRPEGRAQEFFRVARRIEEETVDVAELARRGGLRTVGWLDGEACREIEELAAPAATTALASALGAELAAEGDR